MKKLLEFVQHKGEFSSTRLFMLLVVFSFIFTWIYSVIVQGKFEPTIELLVFVSTTLGFKVLEGWNK
jgi:hypothetical protein